MSRTFFPRFRRSFLARTATLAFAALLGVTGCRQTATWENLEGRWFDQDRDQHMEVTPNRLLVEVVRNPAQVAVSSVSLGKDRLLLRSVSVPWLAKSAELGTEAQTWSVDVSGTTLALQTGARQWNLKKGGSADLSDRPRPELTGLWRQVRNDQKIDYFEFTPWATVASVTWEPPRSVKADKPAAELIPIAQWWSYSSSEQGRLQLNGVSRDSSLGKISAKYSLEANTLTLQIGQETFTLRKTDKVEL